MGKNIPAFVALYIYVQFISCPLHTLLALLAGVANPFLITKNICDVMGVKFRHTPKSEKLVANAMFLCNHRSWGDFFIDQAVCGGGAYLSRYMVILGCPMSSLYAWIAHSTWFFNRKKGLDRDELGKTLQQKWLHRETKGLVVYPEGTRNQKKEPLRLKTGVLKMAFDYNRPVQSVITTNKELIANEKNFHVERNVVCVTSISKPIQPREHSSFEEFVEAVRKQFEETWHDAYGVDPHKEGVAFQPPLGHPPPGFEPLPIPRRAWIVRILILLVTLYWYLNKKP